MSFSFLWLVTTKIENILLINFLVFFPIAHYDFNIFLFMIKVTLFLKKPYSFIIISIYKLVKAYILKQKQF